MVSVVASNGTVWGKFSAEGVFVGGAEFVAQDNSDTCVCKGKSEVKAMDANNGKNAINQRLIADQIR
ncbi:MAG: hypothetical protein SF123_13685 [Chloroflexota bacterium]|nr:hypothetical protein [Chloroflexota bacterium]